MGEPFAKHYGLRLVDVELTPALEPEIAAAIAAVLAADGAREPDPWWQAGIDDALET
jgi:hypothetical protein